VDAALDGFCEPQFVSLAYQQSEWTVAFLEHRYGTAGIHRMLGAFAAGKDTEDALRSALGLSLTELDEELARWSLGDAPRTVKGEVVHYELQVARRVEQAQREEEERGESAGLPRLTGALPPSIAAGAVKSRIDPDALARWHGRYEASVAPIRDRLGPVLQSIDSPALDDTARGRCRELRRLVQSVVVDPAALHAPDAFLERDLTTAFAWMEQMTVSCERGDLDAARSQRVQAQAALGRVMARLDRYGLRL
jgi:hypothetical protein